MIGMLQPRADGRRLLLGAISQLLAAPAGEVSARQKILVIRPDHLGDLLFLTPALRQIRRGLPEAEIVGLVGPWGKPTLERNPDLNRLLTWEFSWFDRKPRSSPVAPYLSLLRLAYRLRTERFDLALQFRADFWWGALAVRLAGIPEHIGYAAPTVEPLLTRALPIQHGRHAVEENLALADTIARRDSDTRLAFAATSRERERAAALLAPLKDCPTVALQAGAGARVKLWPAERLAAVGQALRDEYGVGVVVLGGPGEQDIVNEVMAGLAPGALPLAGRTTLGELAAVLERCALAIGPDSGPLHLAVAVGTPSLHLYGPADARRFGPWGDPSWHRVIASPRGCAPCHRLDFALADLPNHPCLPDLPIDPVLRSARDLLDRSLARRAPSSPPERGHDQLSVSDGAS